MHDAVFGMGRGPQLGDFGLSSGGGWGGWLIRLGTFSRWAHSSVVIGTDPLEIVEATPGGARQRLATPDEFVWSRCGLTTIQRQRIAAEAIACIGYPYDVKDIAGFVLRFFGATLRGKSGDHADDRLICSELVTWCYRVAGHEVAPSAQIAPGDVSPGDLADHITRESP